MGDLATAHDRYVVSIDGLERAGHIADVLGCAIAAGDFELTLGRLNDAQHTFERSLGLAQREDPALRGSADMHVGLGRVALDRNDLAAASDHLRRSEELGESAELPQNPYRWRVQMARLHAAQGHPDIAMALLEEAERVYVGDYSPNVQPVHAARARQLVANGDVAEALAWAQQHHLSAEDELSYLHEYEHVTLARVLLAQQAPEVHVLLDRLLSAAEDGGRVGTVIEILALQALAQRDTAPLARALALAEPEGWVRVFVGEGEPMRTLLATLARDRPSAYVQRMVDAAPTVPRPVPSPRQEPVQQPLVDPLSERELVVLRLLATDLDGPSIARELVVSLNTVRTHTKHVYTKLGVNNRRSAVSRANELGLLNRSVG